MVAEAVKSYARAQRTLIMLMVRAMISTVVIDIEGLHGSHDVM